jgi:penicillin-binding protein 1A
MATPFPEIPQVEEPPRPRARGCGWIFFLCLMAVGSFWGAALGAFMGILDDAGETIAALEDFRPKIGSKVYSSDGELLGEFTIEQRRLVRLADMPLHLQKAFLATEDALFYQHRGVRPDAIISAGLDSLRTGNTRGGSTITQQLVRNVESLNVGLEVTLSRKIREAIVAMQVEQEFTKDEILELYLNQIFLGISANGVETASQQYFAKSCRDLTLSESATLAGLTRWPNSRNPLVNFEVALDRRNVVLAQMLEHKFITRQEYERALAEDLAASVITKEEREQMRAQNPDLYQPNKFDAPYFVEEVRKKILAEFGKEKVFEDGLEIYTTVDMRLQRAAERVLFAAMDDFDAHQLEKLKRQGKESEFVPVTGALVCLDNREPYQGFVRALVGGRDFNTKKFNNATQALRQAGSSVKPFVWAAAIDNGMTASTIITDTPYSRRGGNGQMWSPQNFDGKFSGPVPLRHALEKSINIVSIKLVEQLGMPLVRSYMQRAGISTPIPNEVGLTLALGTPDVYIMDLAVAYSVFPNGGVRHDPTYITEIFNRDGLRRYNYLDYQTKEENALDPRVAYVMTHIMQGVCTPGDGFHPTGHRTEKLGRPRGGKTGTTNDNRNVWFCGFTPDFTTVVWMGYSDNRSLGAGRDYTGGRLASPVWTEFMIAAEEGLPVRDFAVPDGIEFFNINRFTGVEGGNYREAYVKGTRPPGHRPPAEASYPTDAAAGATPLPPATPVPEAGDLLEPLAMVAN